MSAAELWIVASTVIFIALAWKPAGKALGSGLNSRRDRIVHDLEEAARLRAEAEALLADAKLRHQSAARDAADIVAFAQAETARLRERAEADMKQSIARRERQASDRIAQAEKTAIAEIRGRAVDLAMGATAQLIAEKLTGEAGNRLLDEVVSTLPAKLANTR